MRRGMGMKIQSGNKPVNGHRKIGIKRSIGVNRGVLENERSFGFGDFYSLKEEIKIGKPRYFTKMGIKRKTLLEESKRVLCVACSGCRGRIRTSTGQLAVAQSVVVNPSHPEGRHYTTFILWSPPPRQGGMSAKFHHPTVLDRCKERLQCNIKEYGVLLRIIQ